MISITVSLATTFSIIQQVYYACEWRMIRTVQLEQAQESLTTPSIGFGPLSTGFNFACYEIQFYCYTVNSLLIFFWAVALAKGVYNVKAKGLLGREWYIATASKVFALLAPSVLIGISFSKVVQDNAIATVALSLVLSRSRIPRLLVDCRV